MRQAQKQNKRQKKHIQKKWIRNAMAMLCVFALVLQFGNITAKAASMSGKSVTLPVKNGETKTEEAASEAATEKVTEQENSSESSDSEKTTEVSSSTEDTTEKETGKPESSTEVTIENPGEETSGETGNTEDRNNTEETTEETMKDTTEETTGSSETEAGKEEETEEEETGKEENGSGIVVSGGIQIDGMYDDWEGIPKTEITYTSNNAQCNHFGQMYTDGTYIYARFQANQLYTSRMQIQIWNLTINGQTFALQILPEKNGSIDWSTPTPTTEGHHTNLKVFIGYGNNNECDSNVVYSIYDANHAPDTPGDEIEFSFSLERLSELTGIPVDQMGTITLSNPNLGGEGVTIAGSSTGPMAGIMAAFILAAAFLKRKKQRGLQVK